MFLLHTKNETTRTLSQGLCMPTNEHLHDQRINHKTSLSGTCIRQCHEIKVVPKGEAMMKSQGEGTRKPTYRSTDRTQSAANRSCTCKPTQIFLWTVFYFIFFGFINKLYSHKGILLRLRQMSTWKGARKKMVHWFLSVRATIGSVCRRLDGKQKRDFQQIPDIQLWWLYQMEDS